MDKCIGLLKGRWGGVEGEEVWRRWRRGYLVRMVGRRTELVEVYLEKMGFRV